MTKRNVVAEVNTKSLKQKENLKLIIDVAEEFCCVFNERGELVVCGPEIDLEKEDYLTKKRLNMGWTAETLPNESCQLCLAPYIKQKVNFDHCHDCEKFRGWICAACNKALGLAQENIETLKRMKIYLQTHSEKCTDSK